MQKNTPYLDIYKNEWKIIFQLWKDIFLDKNSDDFFKYLKFLKNQKINVILLDEFGKQIFNTDWNNYFLDREKKDFSENINNILLLENNLKLKNLKWDNVEFVSKDKLKEILLWKNKEFKIANNSDLYKKLNKIYKILKSWVNKVTLTDYDWIEEEIGWFGSWVMFVNLEESKFKKLNNFELFKQIYRKYYSEWKWKERTDPELKKLSDNYKILELDWTVLWWYAFTDFEKNINWKNTKWKLLENLFSSKNGWGIWKVLWNEIISEEWPIFAYSKAWGFFKKLWFKKVKWEKSESWADLWKYNNLIKK